MSKRFYEIFLFDVYVAILKIEQTVNDFSTATALQYDYKAWDSVIREFEIIGEAMKHLINSDIMSEKYRVIVDFRNLLTHHYFGIDAEEIWDVMVNDLPDLKVRIISEIQNIPSSLKEKLIKATKEQNFHLTFIENELNRLF